MNYGFPPAITLENLSAATDQYKSHFSLQLLKVIAPDQLGMNADDTLIGPEQPDWVTEINSGNSGGGGWDSFVNGLSKLLGAVDKGADIYGKLVDPKNPNGGSGSGGMGGPGYTTGPPETGKTNWILYAAIGAVVLLVDGNPARRTLGL